MPSTKTAVERSGIKTAEGLNVFDPGTGTFAKFILEPGDPQKIGGIYTTCICEDNDGFLWVSETGAYPVDVSGGTSPTSPMPVPNS